MAMTTDRSGKPHKLRYSRALIIAGASFDGVQEKGDFGCHRAYTAQWSFVVVHRLELSLCSLHINLCPSPAYTCLSMHRRRIVTIDSL